MSSSNGPHVQHRSDHSTAYRILETLIKPLRPRLVTSSKTTAAGSPKLDPPKSSVKKCRIQERQIEGIWVYDFHPNPKTDSTSTTTPEQNLSNNTSSKTDVIYYFSGGGFSAPPSKEHWKLCAYLSEHLSSYEVCLVSYPLAPNNPASVSLPLLRRWVVSVMELAESQGQKVTLMGDSAGGNVALSLAFWWVCQRTDVTSHSSHYDPSASEISTEGRSEMWFVATPKVNTLKQVFLICPPVDLRNTNPDMEKIDVHDPLLGKGVADKASKAWTASPPKSSSSNTDDKREKPSLGTSPIKNSFSEPNENFDASDPAVSPLLHTSETFIKFAQSSIPIHVCYATLDVLYPDADLFREKCAEFHISGEWLRWEGSMHCSVLMGVYRLKIGGARKKVKDKNKLVSEHGGQNVKGESSDSNSKKKDGEGGYYSSSDDLEGKRGCDWDDDGGWGLREGVQAMKWIVDVLRRY